MKLIKTGIFVAAAACFTLQASADQVNSAAVTTFQPGTTLKSQDINTSINALVTAINDNAKRIAALEQAGTASTTPSVSGKQYCIHSIETGFFIHSPLSDPNTGPYPLGATTGSSTAGVSLKADHTGTVVSYEDNYREGFPGSSVIDASEPLNSQALTWTLTGNRLVLTVGTQTVKVGVSMSGDVLVNGAASTRAASNGSGTWYLVNHTVGVQVDDASNCNGIFSS